VTRRRVIPLVLAVVGLLAVVAVAARGRPLSSHGSGNGGLPHTFWDFAFTTLLILVVLTLLVGAWALMYIRRDPEKPKSFGSRTARALAILIGVAVLVFFVGRHIDLFHLLHPHAKKAHPTHTPTPRSPKGRLPKPGSRSPHFRWAELAVVLGVLALVASAAFASRARRGMPRWGREAEAAALVAALDESLDDLRAEPDLRRAIVAAYARMEAVLGRAGLPRRPSEAPLEYLARALLALDASAGAVRRLTDLFEWARFSQHEPEPSMRDEAVDALVAIRDELRAADPVGAR
jgi:hypothetical protein